MGNLSFLEEEPTTAQAIDAFTASLYTVRERVGVSQIGHPCDRWVYYQHNQAGKATPPSGRVLRLFQLGSQLEEMMAIDLMSAGFQLYDRQRYVEFTQDNLKLHGSVDGVVKGLLESPETPHLWECKSVADKGFQKFKKDGYEAYSEQYKTQIHCYAMALKLKRVFVTVINKNTSEIYTERIKTDKEYAVSRLLRAFDIIGSSEVPGRKCPRADWFEAKFCNFADICWERFK